MGSTRSYGTWPSPIAAAELVAGSSAPREVWAEGGITWWAQSRPDQGGRTQLIRRDPDGTLSDVLPPDGNARTRVHEYGGGEWWVAGDVVFAASWADQRVYRYEQGAEPVAITPEPPSHHAWRYADGRLTADGAWVVCVRERHEGPDPTEVFNELVLFPARPAADGSLAEAQVLFSQTDFVAAPRLSPDGRLAWLTWDRPDMPWTSTRLWVGDLITGRDAPGLQSVRAVAGGPGEALVQPEWAPDGTLYVVSDRDEWWNVYRAVLPAAASTDAAELEPVFAVEAEITEPAWVFGQSQYVIDDAGTVWMTYPADGHARLVSVDPATGERQETVLEFSGLGTLRADGDRLVAYAASLVADRCVVEWDRAHPDRAPVVLRAVDPHPMPAGSISVPRQISFPSASGRTAHAWLYLPANAEFQAPAGEAPPLIVEIHGGPTAAASPSFHLEVQYWTTRGFAVVDVDYGGSTGYGRTYRELLNDAWGIVDVEDACAAATFLAEQGVVDGRRMAIRGGSAGGFTTLAALAQHDVFTAGTSMFGVADLGALARDTHKFESRYLDGLVGPWPEAKAIYDERSPLSHIDGFDRPLLVLQGDEDKVVPVAQAQAIVDALQAKSVPHAYLLFAGEQHGFRKAENIIRAQEAELLFYGKVWGFEPAGDLPPLDIAFAEQLPLR